MFVFLSGLVTAVFFVIGILSAAVFFLLVTIFIVFFFRNPERVAPDGEGLVVSPADGTVIETVDVADNRYTNAPAKKVSIFMSVLNVHVNRAPADGVIKDINYHRGKFFVASLDKASESNERNAIILNTPNGLPVAMVQIAGVIARRIVCYLSRGDSVRRGERFGLIRFGSRVELYLPPSAEVAVKKGDKLKAGVSVIGRLS